MNYLDVWFQCRKYANLYEDALLFLLFSYVATHPGLNYYVALLLATGFYSAFAIATHHMVTKSAIIDQTAADARREGERRIQLVTSILEVTKTILAILCLTTVTILLAVQ